MYNGLLVEQYSAFEVFPIVGGTIFAETLLTLTILNIIAAIAEEGVQTLVEQVVECRIVGGAQKFVNGLQNGIVGAKYRQHAVGVVEYPTCPLVRVVLAEIGGAFEQTMPIVVHQRGNEPLSLHILHLSRKVGDKAVAVSAAVV